MRRGEGRCAWAEGNAAEGAMVDGAPAPKRIEVWLDSEADASECLGLQPTEAGRSALWRRRMDAAGLPEHLPQGPADPREWARKAVGA